MSDESNEGQQKFDLILYGATSFVGQIMAQYLADYSRLEESESFTWAIAARSTSKLNALKGKINAPDLTIFEAEASDKEALADMCKNAKVVVSTVGPYALYGETLVELCATSGTDYCDLTGEPQWIKAMLDKYEASAKASGARIVHCCGFDSIPSDLGVYALQKRAIQHTQKPLKHIKMRVHKIKGSASGGTVASMLNVLKEAKDDPKLKRVLVNPYVLCPKDHPYSARQINHKKAQYDKRLHKWTMPFIMAAINERIVHRSNALLRDMYGKNFKYDEAMTAKKGFEAWSTTLMLGGFMLAASFSPLRNLLAKKVLPKPGEGPSEEAQLKGMFDMRFYGEQENGDYLIVKVEGDRDPGYGSTAKMLSQAALCLAKDVNDAKGGFWTPASLLSDKLIERLEKNAGVKISFI